MRAARWSRPSTNRRRPGGVGDPSMGGASCWCPFTPPSKKENQEEQKSWHPPFGESFPQEDTRHMLCFHVEFAIFCQGSRDPQGRPAKGTRFTLLFYAAFLRSCQHKNGLVQGPSLRDRLAFRKGGNSLHIHACVVSLAINIPEAALPPTAMKVEVWEDDMPLRTGPEDRIIISFRFREWGAL